MHQHMIQGDLTELQVAALKWRAMFNKAKEVQVNFKVLHESLKHLEEKWKNDALSQPEVSSCLFFNSRLNICTFL